ncbi:Hypothetical protein NGAL_HAMBI2427_36440 [Neorhizobium galegae bv. orientalis]|nr:Hypothetical protein NGAL_HAMBI2427_36440 [Neorhizobium galegae bv. orientalis]
MTLTHKQRNKIFEEGETAAILKQVRFACPYLHDETRERIDIWFDGFNSFKP